jgi:hypothetical protein
MLGQRNFFFDDMTVRSGVEHNCLMTAGSILAGRKASPPRLSCFRNATRFRQTAAQYG